MLVAIESLAGTLRDDNLDHAVTRPANGLLLLARGQGLDGAATARAALARVESAGDWRPGPIAAMPQRFRQWLERSRSPAGLRTPGPARDRPTIAGTARSPAASDADTGRASATVLAAWVVDGHLLTGLVATRSPGAAGRRWVVRNGRIIDEWPNPATDSPDRSGVTLAQPIRLCAGDRVVLLSAGCLLPLSGASALERWQQIDDRQRLQAIIGGDPSQGPVTHDRAAATSPLPRSLESWLIRTFLADLRSGFDGDDTTVVVTTVCPEDLGLRRHRDHPWSIDIDRRWQLPLWVAMAMAAAVGSTVFGTRWLLNRWLASWGIDLDDD